MRKGKNSKNPNSCTKKTINHDMYTKYLNIERKQSLEIYCTYPKTTLFSRFNCAKEEETAFALQLPLKLHCSRYVIHVYSLHV